MEEVTVDVSETTSKIRRGDLPASVESAHPNEFEAEDKEVFPLILEKKGIKVEKTGSDHRDLRVSTDIYGETKIIRHKETVGEDAWYVERVSPYDGERYGMRLQPLVRYAEGEKVVDRTETRVSLEKIVLGKQDRQEIISGTPVCSLLPEEIWTLVNSGCLGVAIALSAPGEAAQVLADYEKSVVIDEKRVGRSEAEARNAGDKALAEQLQAYEKEVGGLFDIEKQIIQRREYLEALSFSQQNYLEKARSREFRLREKDLLSQTAKIEWVYMKDKPWFWKKERFYPPVGIVTGDSKVSSGENLMMGAVVDLDREGELCVLAYDQNVRRVASEVEREIPFTADELESVSSQLDYNQIVNGQETGKMATLIRRLARTRLHQNKLSAVDQMVRQTVGHELRHVHDRESGLEPDWEESDELLFIAHETVAYLTDATGSDIPFNLLKRLHKTIERYGDLLGGSVQDFVTKASHHDTGSRSTVGGVLALDFMLKELVGVSLFDSSLTGESSQVVDFGRRLARLVSIKAKDLEPTREKIIDVVGKYDSVGNKTDWLRDELDLNLQD